MNLERVAFAVAFGIGIVTAGAASQADGPGEPEAVKQVKVTEGKLVRVSAAGFFGNPGPARIGPCEVSARIDGKAIVVEVKRFAEEGATPDFELVAYRASGNPMSRMGPQLIECLRTPVGGKGTTRIALDATLAGTEVTIVAKPAKGAQPIGSAYVLHVPGEAPAATAETAANAPAAKKS